MVRKQLYLEERQERALKRRAAETGLSEAELVRQALDAVLEAAPAVVVGRPGRAEALERLRATWSAGRSRLAEPFDRAGLYDERLARLGGRRP